MGAKPVGMITESNAWLLVKLDALKHETKMDIRRHFGGNVLNLVVEANGEPALILMGPTGNLRTFARDVIAPTLPKLAAGLLSVIAEARMYEATDPGLIGGGD